MALFSRKNKEEATTKKQTVAKSGILKRDLSTVLLRPRITEKAVHGSERNVYTFVVRQDATKKDVKDAVLSIYKVKPVSVNIVNQVPRQFMERSKGRVVTKKGLKKAYVYLKSGDSINLV